MYKRLLKSKSKQNHEKKMPEKLSGSSVNISKSIVLRSVFQKGEEEILFKKQSWGYRVLQYMVL